MEYDDGVRAWTFLTTAEWKFESLLEENAAAAAATAAAASAMAKAAANAAKGAGSAGSRRSVERQAKSRGNVEELDEDDEGEVEKLPSHVITM